MQAAKRVSGQGGTCIVLPPCAALGMPTRQPLAAVALAEQMASRHARAAAEHKARLAGCREATAAAMDAHSLQPGARCALRCACTQRAPSACVHTQAALLRPHPAGAQGGRAGQRQGRQPARGRQRRGQRSGAALRIAAAARRSAAHSRWHGAAHPGGLAAGHAGRHAAVWLQHAGARRARLPRSTGLRRAPTRCPVLVALWDRPAAAPPFE